MARLFGLLAATGFALTLVALIISVAGYDLGSRFPGVWILVPLGALFFVPFVSCYNRTMGRRPTFRDIRTAFPGWVIALAILVGVNAWVGAGIGFSRMPKDGVIDNQGGHYQIVNHGRLVHPISEAEYHRLEASMLEGMANLLLPFYFLPAAYFLFRNKETEPGSA